MLIPQLKELLDKERPNHFESLEIVRGDLCGYINKDHLIELCGYLRDNESLKFNFLSMITAADYLGKKDKRFELVYSLYSILHHHRILLRAALNENEEAPSLTGLWDTANWQEREVFDMFGIRFAGHPDLCRILMDDDWVGYPQRKDFPLTYEMPEFSHNRGKTELLDSSSNTGVF